MHLGDILRRLDDATDAGLALETMGDVVLFAEVAAMGRVHGETPGEYLANGAGRFSRLADDEAWLALMTAIERADDPSRAVIARILRWALDRDAAEAEGSGHACGCGAGGAGCHGHP